MLKAGQRCRIISRSNQFARFSDGERYEKMVEERNKGSGIYKPLSRSITVPGFSMTVRFRNLFSNLAHLASVRDFPPSVLVLRTLLRIFIQKEKF